MLDLQTKALTRLRRGPLKITICALAATPGIEEHLLPACLALDGGPGRAGLADHLASKAGDAGAEQGEALAARKTKRVGTVMGHESQNSGQIEVGRYARRILTSFERWDGCGVAMSGQASRVAHCTVQRAGITRPDVSQCGRCRACPGAPYRGCPPGRREPVLRMKSASSRGFICVISY